MSDEETLSLKVAQLERRLDKALQREERLKDILHQTRAYVILGGDTIGLIAMIDRVIGPRRMEPDV